MIEGAKMSLKQCLAQDKKLLSVYFTAGYPHLNQTHEIIESLCNAGVDYIEVGFPFSDPLADGPVIQDSSAQALKNGMKTELLFEQLAQVKCTVPLVAMGYINPLLHFGVEHFLSKCVEVGIEAVIWPDLPIEVYEREYQGLFDQYGISAVFLITPQTSETRIRKIDALSKAFIYTVSSSSTTGSEKDNRAAQEAYFLRVAAMDLKNPTIVGFGIYSPETYQKACEYANGAIIGSAFIKNLQADDISSSVKRFVDYIRPSAS